MNAKYYFSTLWHVFTETAKRKSRRCSKCYEINGEPPRGADIPRLVEGIEAAQQQLWKFNSDLDKFRRRWQTENVDGTRIANRYPTGVAARILGEPQRSRMADPLSVAASDLADGQTQDYVVWQRPRIEFKAGDSGNAHPPVLLRDLPQLVPSIRHLMATQIPRTKLYLDALEAICTMRIRKTLASLGILLRSAHGEDNDLVAETMEQFADSRGLESKFTEAVE